MKKVAIIIIGIAALLLVSGIILNILGILNIPNFDKPKKNNEISQEEIDKIYNRDRNKSKDISKKHCLDNLCINSMEITFQKDAFGVVSAVMYNDSEEVVPMGYVNLKFEVNDDNLTLHFYHNEIQPGEKIPLEIHFTDSRFISAKDYMIEYPSDEERLEYEKQRSL